MQLDTRFQKAPQVPYALVWRENTQAPEDFAGVADEVRVPVEPVLDFGMKIRNISGDTSGDTFSPILVRSGAGGRDTGTLHNIL